MTADLDLIGRLAELLAASLTKAGHPAQRVENEHRGYCRYDRCTPACIETAAALTEAVERLEGAMGIEPGAWMARHRRAS